MPEYDAKQGFADCLKYDKHTISWSRAHLLFKGSTDSSIRYMNELNHEGIVSNNREIMPFKSRTSQYYDQMMQFSVEDLIDFCDPNGNWILTKITDRRELQHQELIVEYKVPEEEQYLVATSPRFAPAKLHSSRETPDSSDLIYQDEYNVRRFWALLRLKLNKSQCFVRILNYFGEIDGYNELLRRISNEQKWYPIELLANYVSGLGYASQQLSRQFAEEFVPQFKQIVTKNLLNSPESNIRNMAKDKLDMIVKGMESLLKKVSTSEQKLQWVEQISLELVIICFKSQFLDKKIQSLKYLVDVAKSVSANTFKTITLSELVQKIQKIYYQLLWIKNQQIFEQLFNTNAHLQLITRSTDFLKFLITTENALTNEHMEILWELMKLDDPELKPIIYKVINDVAINLKDNHIAFFQDKITQLSIEQLSLEQIQFLSEMNRFQTKNQALLAQAVNLFWQIAQYQSENEMQDFFDLLKNNKPITTLKQQAKDLEEKSRTYLCDLFKNLESKDHKMNMINQLLSNIQQQRAVQSSLKTLTSILFSFPQRETEKDQFTLQVLLNELIDERNIIGLLVENIISFRQSVNSKKPQDQAIPTEFSKSYMSKLLERISTMKTLIKMSNKKMSEIITIEFLNVMWKELVLTSQFKEESDLMCKWLSELTDNQQDEQFYLILDKFFEENFVQEQFAIQINAEGFECFQILLLKLNERKQMIRHLQSHSVTSIQGLTTTYNAQGQVTAISNTGPIGQNTKVNQSNEPEENEFQYQVCVIPDQLMGINFLWCIVYKNEQGPVVESAVSFLTQLYLNISQQLSEQVKQIRVNLIERVLTRIYQDFSNKQANPTIFKSQIIRSLFILRNLLNESERSGIGSLRSLAGLVKGDLLQLTINNDLTIGQVIIKLYYWKQDIPKKLELKFYSNRTVMELRQEIAKQIKTTWDSIKLIRVNLFNQNREVPDTDNGKTLADIKLKNCENLNVQKRRTPSIQCVPLLTPDGKEMVPVMKKIVGEWFLEFSTNGLMNRVQIQALVEKLTGEKCSLEDSRVKETMDNYDKDHDDYLTLDDFIIFYTHACQERSNVVWKNLHVYHYRNDLIKLDEVEIEKIDETLLPRYILANHEQFFDYMFLLLDEDKDIAAEVWKMLNRLPASQAVLDRVITLQNVKEQQSDWSKIFPQGSPYRLLYILKIIEYLMSDDDDIQDANYEKKDQKMQGEQEKQDQGLWRQEFIAYGGFEQLSQVFKKVVNISHEQESNSINNNILSFILIIVKTYLTAALMPLIPQIYKLQSYCRQTHYTLEQISTNLNEREMEIENTLQEASTITDKQVQATTTTTSTTTTTTTTITTTTENKKPMKVKVKETEEFLQLVERLRGQLGQKILQSLDMLSLYNELQFITISILSKEGEIESEQRQIIENGLLYDTEKCQKEFLNSEKTEQFLTLGLFTNKNILIRKMFSHLVYLLSYSQPERFGPYFIKLFLSLLQSVQEISRRECAQYFDVFSRLIEEQPNSFDTTLASQLINYIKITSCSERRSSIVYDKTFCGYLSLLDSVLRAQPSLCLGNDEFAQYILETCLFEVKPQLPEQLPNLIYPDPLWKDPNMPAPLILLEYLPQNYVKCKSIDSRKVAFHVLSLLVKSDPSLHERIIQPFMENINIPLQNNFNYKPSSEIKSYQGYVGIKNLGCICYMNAVIQQFYMCQTFRYAVMALQLEKKPAIHKDREGNEIQYDENPVNQLRRMFGFLEFSDRPDYNPYTFCLAFKDHTGHSVNVAIQQDAQEFLNMMFDKLEQGPNWWKQLVKGVFGGKVCTQVKCKCCGNLREVEELFYNLSVTVKAVKNVHESLEHLTQGEIINDYFCEACEKRSDIQRRQCLFELPNILIVHLQRIVFNLDTLQNEKMSNRVQFPHQLSLEPYTREGLEMKETGNSNNLKQKDYYEYKLKGVVVHKGTAQYGHYYSYINYKQDKWLEFNDSVIKDFDVKKLPGECFGGKESEQSNDFWSKGDTSSTNAYMLVYEKVIKNDIEIQFNSLEEKNFVLKSLDLQFEQTNELKVKLNYDKFNRILPEDLYKDVWLDNHQFMFEKHIYSEEFFKFNRDLLINVKYPDDYVELKAPETKNICVSIPSLSSSIYQGKIHNQEVYEKLLDHQLFIVFDVLPYAFENSIIKEFLYPLKNLINVLPHQAFNLLNKYVINRKKRVLETMVTCPDSNSRIVVSQLVLHLLNAAIQFNQFTLDISILSINEDTNEKRLIQLLIYFLEQLNTEVAKNWTKFGNFLEFIRDFVFAGTVQQQFALQVQLISILADFFLEKASPLWVAQPAPSPINFNFQNKKHTMGNKFQIPFFSPIFQTIANLINFPLTPNDLACLNYPYFFAKAIPECSDLVSLNNILTRLMWENEDLQRSLADVIIEAIQKANFENINPYLQILPNFLNIVDQFQEQRIEWLLGYPQPLEIVNYSINDSTTVFLGNSDQALLSIVYNNRKRQENYSILILKTLLQVANNNNKIFAYIFTMPTPSYTYAKYTDWIEPFIEQYVSDAKKYNQTAFFNRVENGEECLNLWKIFKEKGIVFSNDYPAYFIGSQISSKLISKQTFQDIITIECIEQVHNMAISLPNGKTNELFPESVLYNSNYIQPMKIDPKSNIWKLISNLKPEAQGIPAAPPLNNFAIINGKKLDGIKIDEVPLDIPPIENAPNVLPENNYKEKKKLDLKVDEIEQNVQIINKVEIVEQVQLNQKQDDTQQPMNNIEVGQISTVPQLQLIVDVNIFESNFIRKYKVTNDSDNQVYITIQFELLDQQSNFRPPIKMCKVIKGKSTENLLSLVKLHADQEWGPYNETIVVNISNQEGLKSELKTESKPAQTEPVIQLIGPQLPGRQNSVNEDVYAQKSCLNCTLLQPAMNAFCELCGGELA